LPVGYFSIRVFGTTPIPFLARPHTSTSTSTVASA
jgi:hypothetical protein